MRISSILKNVGMILGYFFFSIEIALCVIVSIFSESSFSVKALTNDADLCSVQNCSKILWKRFPRNLVVKFSSSSSSNFLAPSLNS